MQITFSNAEQARDHIEALRIAAKQWDAQGEDIAKKFGGTSQLADDTAQAFFAKAIAARTQANAVEQLVIAHGLK